MAEGYIPIKAEDLHPGYVVLIPPASGRHRTRGAIDGSSHMTVREVTIDTAGLGYVEVTFTDCSMVVRRDLRVNVVVHR